MQHPQKRVRAAAAMRRRLAPSLVIASGDGMPMGRGNGSGDGGTVHVCRDTACMAPTADIDAVLAALHEVNAYVLE